MRSLSLCLLLALPAASAAQDRVWTRHDLGTGKSEWKPSLYSHPATRAAGLAADYRAKGYEVLVLPDGKSPGADAQPAARPLSLVWEPDLLMKSHARQEPPQDDRVVAEVKRMVDDTLAVVRRVDARLAAVESQMPSVSAQLTRLESRLTKLERGTVEPWRTPATLTDPVAAAAAGRVVGTYDQFGRFVPTGTAPLPPPTFAQPVMLRAAPVLRLGAGACSSGR